MKQYLDLLNHILTHGRDKPSRPVLKDGRHPVARSVFGYQFRCDLRAGFPLLTTKKMNLRLPAEELVWFLSGSTDARRLMERNVHIWDAWADETGDCGPIYGKQWRAWEAPGGAPPIDQIAKLVGDIVKAKLDPHAPEARRLMLSAWNVADIPRMHLASCHALAQFNVTEGRLSCQLYQRSADVFLGVPFNLASYALLTHLLAQVTGLGVGDFIHTFGDAHIYDNHLDPCREQASRTPRPLPTLVIDPGVTCIDDFRAEHFRLEGYCPLGALSGEVAV